MHSDLRGKIFAAEDMRIETVEVPEWDCTVYIHSITQRESQKLLNMADKDGGVDAGKLAQLVEHYARDENGELVFVQGDGVLLMEKNSKPINRIVKVILKMANVEDDFEALAEKN